jgi:hypothetical protein
MVEAVWGRFLPSNRHDRRELNRWSGLLLRTVAVLRWSAVLAALFMLGWGLATELRTSYLQSRFLTRLTADMNFAIRSGPSEAVRFPKWGPYEERLGYARLPSFIES